MLLKRIFISIFVGTFIVIVFFFLTFLNLYSCPHFLTFPSSRYLVNKYFKTNKIQEKVPFLSTAQIKNLELDVECGRGSDDELEIITARFEYALPEENTWTSKEAVFYTDFNFPLIIPSRHIVEFDIDNYPYSP